MKPGNCIQCKKLWEKCKCAWGKTPCSDCGNYRKYCSCMERKIPLVFEGRPKMENSFWSDADIADRLREGRRVNGLSQLDLGKATDIPQSKIAMLELPKYGRQLTLAQAVRVCSALKISLDWLAIGKGEGPGNAEG